MKIPALGERQQVSGGILTCSFSLRKIDFSGAASGARAGGQNREQSAKRLPAGVPWTHSGCRRNKVRARQRLPLRKRAHCRPPRRKPRRRPPFENGRSPAAYCAQAVRAVFLDAAMRPRFFCALARDGRKSGGREDKRARKRRASQVGGGRPAGDRRCLFLAVSRRSFQPLLLTIRPRRNSCRQDVRHRSLVSPSILPARRRAACQGAFCGAPDGA